MKDRRKTMRVTAVYASVDAETKGDINTEAAMSGYKCGSCGQGTIALSAPEGEDDSRFCMHCGSAVEATKDVTQGKVAKRLMSAEEASLVALTCPSCNHKGITERASLHANHIDGDNIVVHCTCLLYTSPSPRDS